MDEHGSITVSVTVKNVGPNRFYTSASDVTDEMSIRHWHTVLLFISDAYRRVTPEYKLLKRSE
jgi:hypothetical protein